MSSLSESFSDSFSNSYSESFSNSNEYKVVATKVPMIWLNIWYNKLYNKLGWIALSHQEGRKLKIKSYLHRIQEFIASAERKYKDTVDEDRKDCIRILIKNIKKLDKFANNLFNNIAEHIKRNGPDHPLGNAKDRTCIQLMKWHAKKYEKLGLMALLRSEGNTHEIKGYLSNLGDLEASILRKIKKLNDEDKIYDFKVVLHNVKNLRHFAHVLLVE